MATEHDPYRELFERSADAILIIEGETFIDCNQAAVEMLRYERKEDVLSTHPSELSPPTQPDGRDSFSKANEMIAMAFDRGSHRFEWDHKRADGEVFPVEVLLTAVQETDRRVLHVVWRDVTERKHLEAQLRHAQKMEAIGKLVGGIAHDFNNLLVAINANGGLLSRRLVERPEDQHFVRQILLAGDRAAGLVRQLLAFGRKQELELAVYELHELVANVRALLERIIGENIELQFDAGAERLNIEVDAGQLEQVLMNLASNARDAMPEGGVLRVSTRRVDVSEAPVGSVEPLSSGAYAEISFSDTGTGMDEDTVAQAFEPFFTTKDVGEGTGLGLATSYGIIKQSGGSAAIYSAPGHGTTIKVYLPLTERLASAATEEAEEVLDVRGTERILVAEDDAGVADVVVSVLRENGYDVLETRDGEQALAAYKEHHSSIDLVVSDVVMPKLGGPEWVTRARNAGLSPRVLFMSGYTDDALVDLRASDHSVDLLEKPFSASELSRRVRQALDRK